MSANQLTDCFANYWFIYMQVELNWPSSGWATGRGGAYSIQPSGCHYCLSESGFIVIFGNPTNMMIQREINASLIESVVVFLPIWTSVDFLSPLWTKAGRRFARLNKFSFLVTSLDLKIHWHLHGHGVWNRQKWSRRSRTRRTKQEESEPPTEGGAPTDTR